jgi:hypothetical protein
VRGAVGGNHVVLRQRLLFSEIRWGWAVYEALDRRNVLEMLQYGRNYCV